MEVENIRLLNERKEARSSFLAQDYKYFGNKPKKIIPKPAKPLVYAGHKAYQCLMADRF